MALLYHSGIQKRHPDSCREQVLPRWWLRESRTQNTIGFLLRVLSFPISFCYTIFFFPSFFFSVCPFFSSPPSTSSPILREIATQSFFIQTRWILFTSVTSIGIKSPIKWTTPFSCRVTHSPPLSHAHPRFCVEQHLCETVFHSTHLSDQEGWENIQPLLVSVNRSPWLGLLGNG